MKKLNLFCGIIFIILLIFMAQKKCLQPPTRANCQDILLNGESTGDGVYTIDPDGGDGPIQPLQVYCDMSTDGGGWTLVYAYAYQKSNKSLLNTSKAALINTKVEPEGPSPQNNYRLPLSMWNSISVQKEWLYRAKDKTGGPSEPPSDLWIKATNMRLDPNQEYRAVHDSNTITTASHSCLQKHALVVHSQGPLSGGCSSAGIWDTPTNCAGGPPWPTICCWCITIGTSDGKITPTHCATATVSGNLFYNTNNSQQRCGSNQTAMAGATYGSVSLYVR